MTELVTTLQNSSDEGLKPCPFCGGNAVKAVCHKNPDNYDGAEFWVVCTKCHIKTNRSLDEDEPVDLWNRRVNE